jgi:hypothetical protein
LFGVVFGLFFAKRATSPGAGLIWGLSCAFLAWLMIPTGLRGAREHFPELVACLLCLGAPVGVALGLRSSYRGSAGQPQLNQARFRWGRAVVAGGLAGTIGGLIFSRWMYEGDFFPLLAGFGDLSSKHAAVVFHFAIALLIGATFGLLFQRDIHGVGSSMGWGLGYAMLWWFLGQLTILPVLSGRPIDWSADRGSQLFGSLGVTLSMA